MLTATGAVAGGPVLLMAMDSPLLKLYSSKVFFVIPNPGAGVLLCCMLLDALFCYSYATETFLCIAAGVSASTALDASTSLSLNYRSIDITVIKFQV